MASQAEHGQLQVVACSSHSKQYWLGLVAASNRMCQAWLSIYLCLFCVVDPNPRRVCLAGFEGSMSEQWHPAAHGLSQTQLRGPAVISKRAQIHLLDSEHSLGILINPWQKDTHILFQSPNILNPIWAIFTSSHVHVVWLSLFELNIWPVLLVSISNTWNPRHDMKSDK